MIQTETSTEQVQIHNPVQANVIPSNDVPPSSSSHTRSSHPSSSTSTSTTAATYNANPNMLPSQVAKRVHREIRFGNYILGSTLGEGEFGKVKLGWRKDGKLPSQVAIKLIKRESIARDPDSEIKVHREINSLKLLNHPNIVNLVEVMKSGKYIGIVLEFASGGELFDYILQHKYLKENVAKRIFAQLISGVDYMHSKGLIHRDLKLENLLLDKHKNVIISDFGFVNSYNRDKNDFMKTSCGSPCYAAPELVLTQSPYEGRKVDIWSLGVILYAMLSGYLPFDDDPDNIDGADIVKLYHYICKTPLTFPEYISPLARDLLRKIIVPDPKQRINMDEIRVHPWLTPHVNLLSIRQPEWDRIHKENMTPMFASMNVPNKRYSMIAERTTSVSLVPGRGRSSSNSNMVNQLYINPVPTTQRSLANAVAVNSNSGGATTSSSSSSNSKVSNNTNITNSTTAPISIIPNSANYPILNANPSTSRNGSPTSTKQVQRGHTKSASISYSTNYTSASTALKAVVSENDNKRNSISSFSSITSSQYSNSVVQPLQLQLQLQYASSISSGVSRSNTFVGSSVISTIAESPNGVEKKANSNTNKQPDGIRPFIGLLPSGGNAREKLPHSEKKPRPTSYHPSSLTSTLFSASGSNGSSNGLLEYMNLQILSNSPPKSSAIASESEENISSAVSGSAASAHSRRNSVITPVHVNGLLTSEHHSHENKNSVLTYLEDKMDTLELTDLHSPVKQNFVNTPEINNDPLFDNQFCTPKTEFEVEKMTPDVASTISVTPKVSNVLQSRESKVNIEKKSVGKHEKSNLVNHQHEKTTQKKERLKEEDKENNEIKEQKKRNRFSILSFYSTYSASSNNIASSGSGNGASSSSTNLPHTSSSSNGKKVLEQSSVTNVLPPPSKEKKRIGSSGSSNSSKTTSSGSRNHGGSNSSTSSAGNKEASAARKVIDFFKRRSIRIG